MSPSALQGVWGLTQAWVMNPACLQWLALTLALLQGGYWAYRVVARVCKDPLACSVQACTWALLGLLIAHIGLVHVTPGLRSWVIEPLWEVDWRGLTPVPGLVTEPFDLVLMSGLGGIGLGWLAARRGTRSSGGCSGKRGIGAGRQAGPSVPSPPAVSINAAALGELKDLICGALRPAMEARGSREDQPSAELKEMWKVLNEIEKAVAVVQGQLERLRPRGNGAPSTCAGAERNERQTRRSERPRRMSAAEEAVDGRGVPESEEALVPAWKTVRRGPRREYPSEQSPRVQTANRFAPLGDEGSQEDLEADTDFPALEDVVFLREVSKPGRAPGKRARVGPARTDGGQQLSESLLGELAKLTEAQALDVLREREAAQRAARRPPEYLTDEEKQLTMDQLFRRWKVERQRERNEREQLRMTDFEPLGELTDEQKLLRRVDVKRLVNQRKSEVWAKAMRAKGITVHECAVCHHLHTGNHECLQTRWTTEGARNTGITKEVVLTRSAQGVAVRTTPVIDGERIEKGYQRYKVLREEAEARKKLMEHESSMPPEETCRNGSSPVIMELEPPDV